MTLFCVCKPGVTDKWCPAACEQQHLWDGCSQWVHFILHPTLFFCLFFSCCFLVARGPTHALKTCKRSTKSQKLNPWLVAVDPCAVQSRWSSKTKTSRHFIDAKLGVNLMRIDGFAWIYDHISGRWGEKPLMRLTEVLTCAHKCCSHLCSCWSWRWGAVNPSAPRGTPPPLLSPQQAHLWPLNVCGASNKTGEHSVTLAGCWRTCQKQTPPPFAVTTEVRNQSWEQATETAFFWLGWFCSQPKSSQKLRNNKNTNYLLSFLLKYEH